MLNHPDITSNQLSVITNPVLVVAGSDDVIKDEHTRLIHKLIRNSELAIIPNATHYIPFEQPDKLNELMLNFLKINPNIIAYSRSKCLYIDSSGK